METLLSSSEETTSFQKIAGLEAALELQKIKTSTEMESLRTDLKAAIVKIDQLMVILEALEGLANLAKVIEKIAVWIAKFSIAVGVLYAMYKFGLAEIAEKVKAAGGK